MKQEPQRLLLEVREEKSQLCQLEPGEGPGSDPDPWVRPAPLSFCSKIEMSFVERVMQNTTKLPYVTA